MRHAWVRTVEPYPRAIRHGAILTVYWLEGLKHSSAVKACGIPSLVSSVFLLNLSIQGLIGKNANFKLEVIYMNDKPLFLTF
jgi:hypothetical protein